MPPPARPCLNEPALSTTEAMQCTIEIERLCQVGALAIAEPMENQFLSSFFLIPKSSGGVRFILNLRDLNRYISPPHFKMEDWILRFQWRNILYEFTSLLFGLSTAPYIFTKIVRPVVKALRARGVQSVVYLDDFLLLGESEISCLRNIHETVHLLSSLGFLVNYTKSQLKPFLKCKYLGFIFDSAQQSIAIPSDRRRHLRTEIQDISQKSRCSIREFASKIGSLISVCPAVLYGLLYTKRFEREKFLALESNAEDYEKQMPIPEYLKEDFEWWLRVLANENQCNRIRLSSYALEIFSDASLTGWGASCGDQRTHGWWASDTKTLHINALELLAAFYALKCCAADLRNCNILLRLDNTTAIAYINKFGSIQYPSLSDISRKIWGWCKERNIYLFALYIASLDNIIADAESRIPDTDTECSLSIQAFNRIKRKFGPFDIDLFASITNAK